MRALVVYESMFGNTRNVALAVAEGIGTKMAVEAIEVGAAPAKLASDVGLLVVGCPTHIHGMSTAKSRATASERAGGPIISSGAGMREWLATLRPEPGLTAAAFDTRTSGPMIFTGSAAKTAAKLLRRAGLRQVDEPRSFVLEGPTDQLADRVPTQELAAARAWGEGLAADLGDARP